MAGTAMAAPLSPPLYGAQRSGMCRSYYTCIYVLPPPCFFLAEGVSIMERLK